MYAILRIKKLKSFAGVSGSNGHNQRLNETPNADPGRQQTNLSTGAHDPVQAIKDVWSENGIKPRKNAVVAVEYLLSASPDFFQDDKPEKTKAWAKRNIQYLKEKHGAGFIRADLHLDETTPHIHAIVTPLVVDTPKPKLSAKHYFDRPRLRELQTEYAQAMAPFRLRRGQERSQATHKEIAHYYSEIKKPIELPKEVVTEHRNLVKEHKGAGLLTSHKGMFKRSMKLVKTLAEKNRQLVRKAKALEDDLERVESQHWGAVEADKKLKAIYEYCGYRYTPFNDRDYEKIMQAVRSVYPGRPVCEQKKKRGEIPPLGRSQMKKCKSEHDGGRMPNTPSL